MEETKTTQQAMGLFLQMFWLFGLFALKVTESKAIADCTRKEVDNYLKNNGAVVIN